MLPSEYAKHDALALGQLLAKGEVSAAELIEISRKIIDALDPSLNAVVSRHFDEAQETRGAYASRAPFHGAPFGAKEEGAYYKGIPSGASSRLYAPSDPGYDTNFVTRYKTAGLNLVAKLNMPELAVCVTTETKTNGACRNPWDLSLSPGGSSGGSAAAVAAGYFPAAYGNDGAGSIRIPAACCGVFGFKPSRGRIPKGPKLMDEWAGNVVDHVITRSVRDSAAILDISCGIDVGGPYDAPHEARLYADIVAKPGRRLRIGFSTTAPTGGPVDAACVEAVEAAARLCAGLGHHVEPAAPQFDADILFDNLFTLMCVHVAKEARALFAAQNVAPQPGWLEPSNYALMLRGKEIGACDYVDALYKLGMVARQASAFFESYDVWLAPTLAKPQVPIGTLTQQEESPEAFWRSWVDFIPFTPLANIAGHPAMSSPLHWTKGGLPVGVHFQAKIGDEGTLFALAGELEQAAPWRDRTPPISAAHL